MQYAEVDHFVHGYSFQSSSHRIHHHITFLYKDSINEYKNQIIREEKRCCFTQSGEALPVQNNINVSFLLNA